MKVLTNSIYKSMASILCSDNNNFKTANNIIIFTRAVSIYPSKSIFCLVINRLLHYHERNIKSISLILDIMKEEGEDEEIISNIDYLNKNQLIKTSSEVNKLCNILVDYIRYHKILKLKDPFIKTIDIIDDDETNIHDNVEALYKASTAIIQSYNDISATDTYHSFDTNNPEAMKSVVALAKDTRKAEEIIVTRSRGLNMLLSPGAVNGCVYVYCGLPGNYKSGILLESHVDACLYNDHILQTTNGKTPISMYISMENTMAQTINRLWSILFPTADISMFTVEEATEMINNTLISHGWRSVILYYGYREKSAYDIAQIIQSFNDDENQVMIVGLDYIKRMKPGRTDAAAISSEKAELDTMMNEIKTAIAVQFNIPVLLGHQLNRAGASAVDNMIANGGYDRTSEALGRSNISVAWEILEVADFLGLINIENNGEEKYLMIKAAKQRDIDSKETDASVIAIRHPFYSLQSFALKPDITENVSISIPIYIGKKTTNFMANI